MITGATTVGELTQPTASAPTTEMPYWSRRWPARWVRNAMLSAVWLPYTRFFARTTVAGREHLAGLRGPVIFASNHQSQMDTPAIFSALPARYRYCSAVAMWKKFFDPHFRRERHARLEWLGNSLLYWLLALFFHAFPLPQAESGSRESLRFLGGLVSGGWSVIFFPEGGRTETGEFLPFQSGIGLIAARLGVPVWCQSACEGLIRFFTKARTGLVWGMWKLPSACH